MSTAIAQAVNALETAAVSERMRADVARRKAGQGVDEDHNRGLAEECTRNAEHFAATAARLAHETSMSDQVRDAIKARVVDGRCGGGFVDAVARCDFARAYSAADQHNRAAFGEIVAYRITLAVRAKPCDCGN